MKKSDVIFLKSCFAAILFILVLGFSACNNNPKKSVTVSDSTKIGLTGKGCINLPYDKIKTQWVDNQLTKPGDPNAVVTLSFESNYSPATQNLSVSVTGLNSSKSTLSNSTISNFYADKTCPPPASTTVSVRNYFSMAALNILDATGSLMQFDNVSLSPRQWSGDNTFMSYDIYVVSNGTASYKGESLPCPPCNNCIPPCPNECLNSPNCVSIDTSKLK